MAAAKRDPVSESMDGAARALLTRVYRARGGWAATRLADPTGDQLARWLGHGINVRGPDPVDRGGFNARTRWVRAYTRALWYQHKWFSGRPGGGWRQLRRATARMPGIEIEIGAHRPALGVIPAGYPVRVRTASKTAARRSGKSSERWAWAGSEPRHADPGARDWKWAAGGTGE